jgi:RNA polymerase sigma-70 factor, ECF subfamily
MEPSKQTSEREAELIHRCKAGDKQQFHLLIAPYLQSIGFVAYSILRNREDTEEVVQETALKAFTRLEQLRETESFKAWLLQIATNEARMRLRKYIDRQSISLEGEMQDWESQPRQFIERRNMPSSALEQKELRAALMSALNGLSDKYRTVFILRDVQHLCLIHRLPHRSATSIRKCL